LSPAIRRFVEAAIAGGILGLAPLMLEKLLQGSRVAQLSSDVFAVLAYPGYMCALALARFRFHDVSLIVVMAANVAIYSLAVFLILPLLRPVFGRSPKT
jgi:hypothetical protein